MMNPQATAHWSVPSELMAPAPRAVKGKRRRIGPIAGSLFITPHTLVGIGIIVMCILNPIVIFGTPGRQAVVQKTYSSHSSKNGTSHFVEYAYTMDGAQRVSADQIYRKDIGQFHAGDKIVVHAIRIGSKYYAIHDLSVGGYLAHDGPFWFFAVFWNGIVLLFWCIFWGPIWRARSLVRSGMPTAGTVVGKRTTSGKSTSWNIKYSFSPRESSGEPLTREMQVTKPVYDAVHEGQQVTVLYNPDKPKRSIAYELCDYVAVAI